MRKLDNFLGIAPKLKSGGFIHYEIWSDDNGVLYVRMFENETNSDSENPGTFSKFLIPVSKYMSIRNSSEKISEIEAYDLETETFCQVKDNNNGGFLKAVLSHLLPPTN